MRGQKEKGYYFLIKMKKFKVKINIEQVIYARNKEEALEKFYGEQNYPQHTFDNYIDENTKVTEIK